MADMQELRELNEECIDVHNNLRKLHGAGPIRYNEDLAIAAQSYAEKLAEMNRMEHSSEDERGENIGENLAFEVSPYPYSGRGASVHWYSEMEDYDFNKETQVTTRDTGHFTQVIWQGTDEAGFGRACVPSGKSNTWYIVGRYRPGGNVVELFTENVPPLINDMDWTEVPEAQEYLEELRYYEYTGARRHVMDEYACQVSSKVSSAGKLFVVTEKFVTPDGYQYEESKEYHEDPRLEEKPAYKSGIMSSHFDEDNDTQDDRHNLYEESFEVQEFDEQDHDEPNEVHSDRKDSTRSPSLNSADNATVNMMELSDEIPIQQFIDDVVIGHNSFRTLHGMRNLKLDINLSKYAQDWADAMASEAQISFSDYKFRGNQIGENICVKPFPLVNQLGRKVVSSWYKESRDYDYDDEPENFPKVGHFTQVIWRKSKKIGVGIAECKASNVYFIVCFYYPAGNVSGQFRRNVQGALKNDRQKFLDLQY